MPHFRLKPSLVFQLLLTLTTITACNSTDNQLNIESTTNQSESRLGEALSRSIPTAVEDSSSNDNTLAAKVPSSNTGGWSIDTTNRQLVRSFYNSVYLASENTEMNWTGDQNACTPGVTDSDYKNSVLARVNYYRAMAGVPAAITLNPTYNTKAQQAALMMSANNTLSHNPPNTWVCYTTDGDQAAGSSNLSLGNNGWDAVSGQMRDNGSGNTLVGHRRWLLYPQTQEMGTGDVPANGTFNKANSLWVFDGNIGSSRPTTRDDFVAWPTKGYNPYQVVPVRWSFSYPDADFSNAVVSVTQNGISVPISIDNNSATGYGENTIIWHPSSMSTDYNSTWPKPNQDTAYQVTISDVALYGIDQSYNYTVTIIDPQEAGTVEEITTITGNNAPQENVSESYNFNSLSIADDYDVIIAEIDQATGIFDAEDSGASVTDNTDSSYTLIYSGSGANGTSVYRLAPATSEEIVEFPKVYIPSITGEISFDSKLAYATPDQTAAVQISQDDGASWADIYSITGLAAGPAETNFSNHTISLSNYADSFVKFRAVYRHTGYQYTGTTASVSFLLDNIEIKNSKQITTENTLDNISVNNFSFIPQSGKDYALAVRGIPWLGYPALSWGALFYVTPIEVMDNDSDGIPDAEDPDDDNDGMPDTWELQYGLDPFLATDAGLDPDNDNVSNLNEYLQGTNPLLADTYPPGFIPIILDYLLED